jgi:hypothetical protein
MPSKSKAQRNFMAAAAHNPAFAKKVGIPAKVAKEFNQADKGKKFVGGGMAKENSKMDMAQDKKIVKKAVGMHDKQMHGGKKTDLATLKKGGGVKKMLGGGLSSALGKGVANAVKQNPNMGGTASLGGTGRRGAAAPGAVNTTPNVRSTMMPASPRPAGLGSVVKGSTGPGTIRRAKGGGIEKKGKTKGKII